MKLFGLTEKEVEELQRIYGKNISEIEKSNLKIIFHLIYKNSIELLNALLLFASLISLYFQHYLDFILIFVLFLINIFLGVLQEFKSINYLKNLKKMYKIEVMVIREGKKKKINIENIVPHDLVIIEEGDIIPADGILIKGKLKVNEATFTGESQPVEKNKQDKLWKGTFVEEGGGIIKVEKIGLETKLGKMNKQLIKIEKETTTMEKEINKMFFWLFKILFLLSSGVLIIGIFHKFPISFLIVLLISLIISSIPQGLPVLITSSLALAAKRMAKNKILIRKLKSLEEIAIIDMLFTDKTGTITENKIDIGDIFPNEKKEEILNLAGLASFNEKDAIDRLFLKYKTIEEDERKPFNSKDKYAVAKIKDLIVYKGAVNAIIDLFLLKDKRNKDVKNKIIKKWLKKANEMSKKGLKLIMVAVEKEKENLFEIKGIIGLNDKIRDDVKHVIKELQKNDVKVIILTGDRKETTETILEKVNLKGEILRKEDILKMDDYELLKKLDNVVAFTELFPEDKYRIIKIARKKYNVGMLGDGVNDSLALKKANVSMVVGDGSDLAKGIADIVLIENNLKNIKDLIFEGRNVIFTIKKLVLYTIPTNVVELIVGSIGVFIKRILLKPVQILWINLITDTTPAFLFFKDKKGKLKKEDVFPLLNKKDKKFIIVSSFVFVLYVVTLFIEIRKNLMIFLIMWELLFFLFLKQFFEEDQIAYYVKVLVFLFFIQYFILILLKRAFEISLFTLQEIKIITLTTFIYTVIFSVYIELIKVFEKINKLNNKIKS